MPSEQEDNNDLDEAFQRFGKRLKKKESERDPTRNPEFRAQLEEVDSHAPSKTDLFRGADARLQQLKEEFHIELETPQTLPDQIIQILAQAKRREAHNAILTAADLYSQVHETDRFNQLSSKEFQKTIKQMEKDEIIRTHEIRGTLVVQIRDEFLSEDEATILDVAARKGGKASLEQIMLATQWPQARVRTALNSLITKKMVTHKKSYVGGTRYQVTEEG